MEKEREKEGESSNGDGSHVGELIMELDCLGEVFVQTIKSSNNPKQEWFNWRRVSHKVKERVDRIYLKLVGNQRTSLESFIAFPHLVSSFKTKYLQDFKGIEDAVRKAHYLTLFEINNATITLGIVGKISNSLKNNISITSFVLKSSKINDEMASVLAKSLQNNTVLQILNLSGNEITEKGGIAIASYLERNKYLNQLDLSFNVNLSPLGGQAILAALQGNSSLTHLNLNGTGIGNECGKEFAKMLTTNRSLTHFSFGSNFVGNDGAKEFANAIKANTSLTSLNLIINDIDSQGAKFIADALRVNQSIVSLELYANDIDERGGREFGEALKVNTTLLHLDLGSNIIGVGSTFIAKALETNSTLTTLSIAHNNLKRKDFEPIEDALKKNKSLASLNIKGVDMERNPRIVESLAENTSLTDLQYDENSMSATDCEKLDLILNKNKALRKM